LNKNSLDFFAVAQKKQFREFIDRASDAEVVENLRTIKACGRGVISW
jgi:hypothetical protein